MKQSNEKGFKNQYSENKLMKTTEVYNNMAL